MLKQCMLLVIIHCAESEKIEILEFRHGARLRCQNVFKELGLSRMQNPTFSPENVPKIDEMREKSSIFLIYSQFLGVDRAIEWLQ